MTTRVTFRSRRGPIFNLIRRRGEGIDDGSVFVEFKSAELARMKGVATEPQESRS